jgi:5'-3' exonuclease
MILIFDGNNTFFRNFAANPTSDVNGVPTGGIIGTIKSVKWLLRETKATRVFVVWDAPGGSKKRRAILEEYKAGRKPRMNREVDETLKESSNNLMWQFEKTKTLLENLGVTQIEVQDIEADDAIGYLVGLLDPQQKCVVSSDRDMWQLVSPTTTVYWPTKKVYLTPGNFQEQTQFLPENYVLARAIAMGDSSDNVKAIKGLGEKTLLKIFPFLAKEASFFSDLVHYMRTRLELQDKGDLKLSASEKRWFPVILENEELVKRNIQLMQLTSPIIGAAAAHIIRTAALESKPKFQLTSFKLSLINSGIQLSDVDLFTTFQEYRVRAQNEEANAH